MAGYLAPEHRDYLHGIERRMKDAGLDHEFRYRGVLDRPHKIDFLRNLDVLSVPAPTTSRRASSCWRRWPTACPSCSRGAARFPRSCEKTGGGILVEPDDPASLAEGIFSLWKDPALLAELGKRGARACASTTARRAWPHGRSKCTVMIAAARAHA